MTYEIRTIGKRIVKYDIKGIKKGARNSTQGRRKLLIDIIRKNPSTPHTHIIQIAYEIAGMPKATVEKYLAELEKEKIAVFLKSGSAQNAGKIWGLSEFAKNMDLDDGMDVTMQGTLNIMDKFLQTYDDMDYKRKEKTVVSVLQMFNSLDPLIFWLDKVGIDKYTKNFEMMKNGFYEIIIRDFEMTRLLMKHTLIPNLVKNLKSISELLEFKKK